MTLIFKLISAAVITTAIVSSNSASAVTLYSTLGGTEAGGDTLASVGPVLNDWIKTGTAATLNSATFNLSLEGSSPVGSFQVFAAKIVNGGIAQFAVLGTIQDASLTNTFAYYTINALNYALDANSFYVVGLNNTNHSSATWGSTVDQSVLNRPSVVAGTYYFNSVGGVQANAGGPYELAVEAGGSVPEPATWGLMLVGFGLVGVVVRRRGGIVAA